MDPTRFDHLARALGRPASRRGVLGGLAGGALGVRLIFWDGGSGGAAAQGTDKKGRGRRPPKVPLCHKGKTRKVAIHAVPAHLDHGDTLGPCGSVLNEPPPPTGGCTPLLQICWPSWLGGNPCCDDAAECTYVNGDVPAFFCLDKKGCANDADCRKRFTDRNIACLPHFPATCPHGVSQCCQRKLCPTGSECGEGAVCCNSAATLLKNACCSANQTQICDPFGGCVTP